VHFAAAPRRFTERVLADGPFQRWSLHPTTFGGWLDRIANAPLWTHAEIERSIQEDRALFQSVKPDLVVVDQRPSISISGALSGIPTASITSVIWTADLAPTWRQPVPETIAPYVPVVSQAAFELVAPVFYWLVTRPVNDVRRRYGLRSVGRQLSALFAADHRLFLEPPGLFRLRPNVPANHWFLGAALWSPSAALPDWWGEIGDDRPLIYAGMGTSGRDDLLGPILDALADLPCRVVMATGGRPIPGEVPRNAFLADYLPGDVLARRAALVIGNGGSPGLYQALAEGTPVLAIPHNVDQHRTMAAVAWRGATLVIRSDQFTRARLRRSVVRMLRDGTFRRSARETAGEFTRSRAEELFPRFVDRVVGRVGGH
jgi:UDP:flavonoid glycosyltransferase YjiC (YdhE family)